MLRRTHVHRLALMIGVIRMVVVPMVWEDRRKLVIRMHVSVMEPQIWMVPCVLSLRRSLQLSGGRLLHWTDACLRLHGIEALDRFNVITLCSLESLI